MMSPILNTTFITRKDSVESSSSMDSFDNKKSYLQVPLDGYLDVSDHCYQSCSDSDHLDLTTQPADVDTTKEDSGVEADQLGADFILPDKELSEKIVQQVEFYFSDANITKDAFLLKHVRRNKEGYVSLKLIASFKRVKHISKDWQVVAHALKLSSKLQINDAGTKIRRIDPLPVYDETTPSRTVIAMNLPSEKPTVEGVAEVFRKCGEISLIRILRPGNPIPNDVKQFVNKHAEVGSSVCALVEFEASESARKAINMMNNKENWRSMQVFELVRPASKKSPKKAAQPTTPKIVKSSPDSDDKPSAEDRKRQRGRKKKTRIDSLRRDSGSDRSESDLSVYGPETSPRYIPPRSSPIPCPDRRPRFASTCEPSSASSSSWSSRRRANSALVSPQRKISETNNTLSSTPNVLRMPRGPDGTRGFNRNRSISAPVPPVLTVGY